MIRKQPIIRRPQIRFVPSLRHRLHVRKHRLKIIVAPLKTGEQSGEKTPAQGQ